jgi:hypothetical protein
LFNLIFSNKILIDGFLDGFVTLLFEKEDTNLLKTCRPIRRLNMDYMLYTHILMNRLQRPRTKTLLCDQHAFLKSRLITDNILEDKLKPLLAAQTTKRDVAVFLDQEKTYVALEFSRGPPSDADFPQHDSKM